MPDPRAFPKAVASETPDEFVVVGRVKDAHGLKGELFITIAAGEAPWLGDLKRFPKSLRLKRPGAESLELCGEITAAKIHKNGLIIKSPAVVDRTQAEKLKGCEFEIPAELFVSKPGEALYLREIAGFTVALAPGTAGAGPAGRDVGPIVAFSSNTAQDLLVVKAVDGEFEIPFVEAFVVFIDHEARRITMDIPSGLLSDDD